MLRETFDELPNTRQAHIDDHGSLHRGYNHAIYADDHATLAEACAAAKQHKIPRVLLNPRTTYTLTETLVVPSEVCLDGGGIGPTSLAEYVPRLRAQITTDQSLAALVSLQHYASVRGCWLNGAHTTAVGVLCQDSFFNGIYDNLIARCTSSGIKCGGALYITIKRNIFSLISGYGVDALREYGTQGYYGVNVGLSEGNSYLSAGIRLEGILTSLQDDFEGKFGDGAVVVGGNVQSQMAMYSPYFELSENLDGAPIVCVAVLNSGNFSIRDAQAYGKVADAGAIFIQVAQPSLLHVSGCNIARFATVFSGQVATNTDVSIFGNSYANYATLNAFQYLNQARSVFCVWPGDKIGV